MGWCDIFVACFFSFFFIKERCKVVVCMWVGIFWCFRGLAVVHFPIWNLCWKWPLSLHHSVMCTIVFAAVVTCWFVCKQVVVLSTKLLLQWQEACICWERRIPIYDGATLLVHDSWGKQAKQCAQINLTQSTHWIQHQWVLQLCWVFLGLDMQERGWWWLWQPPPPWALLVQLLKGMPCLVVQPF